MTLDSPEDRADKVGATRRIIAEAGASRLLLTSHGVLSWYLGGARTHISLAADPVFAVIVTAEDEWVVTSVNERERLVDEELPDGIRVEALPWGVPLASTVAGDERAITEQEVAVELRAARASLRPDELARYRALCAESAEVFTDVLGDVTPDLTEQQVAGRVGAGLLARGIDPVVLLAAGRSRLHHRHPLPRPVPIGDRAMFVLCGRRDGMISNATRWVRFGRARTDEADAMARIAEVEADFFDATVPGATIGAAWSAGVAGYARHGFAADEWRNHHQGGAAGYFGRDPLGLPDVADVIQVHQPFAWNPSGPGAKIEDTALTTATGVEVLTSDPRWPATVVRGRQRPIELEL